MTGDQCIPENRYDQDVPATTVAERYATPTTTSSTTPRSSEMDQLEVMAELSATPPTMISATPAKVETDRPATLAELSDTPLTKSCITTEKFERVYPFPEVATPAVTPTATSVTPHTATAATQTTTVATPTETLVATPPQMELKEAEEALLMETEEESGWEDQENPVMPGPSTKPGVKKEQAATEDESDDEIFTDAVAEPTTEDRNDPELLESSQEHPEAETPGPQRVSNEADATANQDDPTNPVAQKQLEMIEGMEGDPPLDEFVQQVFDTYQEEVDANATIPTDNLTTPEPCNAPQITLAGIVNCIRYAARGDMRMTRTANAQAAVVSVLTLARWIPQYQRIAQERDQLLEHQEKWRLEKAAAQKRIKELEGAVKPETGEQITVVEAAAPPLDTNEQSSDSGSPIRARRNRRNVIPSSAGSSIDGITRLRPRTPSPQLARYRVATGTTPAAMGPPPAATTRQATSNSPSPGTSREGLAFLPTSITEPRVVIKPCPISAKIIPKIVLKKNRVSPAKRHHKRKLQCPICRRHC
ncbi:hypothetical protein GE061_001463, partial [Apolygus lucorum]